ncbi:hypothetical protein IGI37_003746 [Enterococcus sp. AZ194]|uniref:DNA alkylation repair protein n=1 Tax=Enterococcus sp. AZ194 TaxID=2774629 RepID=UPI003F22EA12
MNTTAEIVAYLADISSDKYKKNIIKLGIPEENTIGVPTTELRKLARKLPKESAFLKELWETNYHECKILAILAFPIKICTQEDIEYFMSGVVSWDLCDLLCKTLVIKHPGYDQYVRQWIEKETLYYKRAAFVLLASTSVHAELSHQEIVTYLSLIEQHFEDERLLVKKAISWAIRELGKTNEAAKEASIELAMRLRGSDSSVGQWIGKDALKELETLVQAPGRSRLISNKSKMGKEVAQ